MAAGINDRFNKVINGTTRPVATTLASQKVSGATTASLVATTGWDTDTALHGIMYRTDAQGAKVAGSQIDWKATLSGTTLSNFTVTAGSDDTYEVGTTVELSPTAAWGDDMATGLLVEHNQDGTHNQDAAISVLPYIYPVGSIYTNAAVSTNPATLLGFGTWTAFGAGRVMVGLDSGQTEFDTLEETGGHKELAAHDHAFSWTSYAAGSTDHSPNRISGENTSGAGITSGGPWSISTASTGGGNAGNLQPYIVVYMWKRTA